MEWIIIITIVVLIVVLVLRLVEEIGWLRKLDEQHTNHREETE